MTTKKPVKNIYLIDGNSFIYRAYHAIRDLSNSKGFPTNAIYGFTNMLLKIIKERSPQAMAIAFDSPVPTERHRLYEEYKAQRPETPNDLVRQIPYIRKLVQAFRIKTYEIAGYEADDVLATLAQKAAEDGVDVFIVTGDKDMLQVLNGNIRIYDPMKNKIIKREDVLKRFGLPPERIPEVMALTGDSIDNIPGVKGIGEKTATELLKRHTINELIENPGLIEKERFRDLIASEKDNIKLSLSLARIQRNVPVEIDYSECMLREPDWEELLEIFREMEFTSLVRMVPPMKLNVKYCTVRRSEEIEKLLGEIKDEMVLRGYMELPISSPVIGMAISTGKEPYWYIPMGHQTLEASVQITPEDFFGRLKGVFKEESIKKTGHDIKREIVLLKRYGIEPSGRMYDTMIASYLLNPNKSNHSLEEAALDHLYLRKRSIEETLGRKRSLEDLSIEEMAEIAADDLAVIHSLKKELFRRLKEEGLDSVYFDIEMPLVEVLADMEYTGIKVDREILGLISKEIERELSALQSRIFSLAGEEFNINSPRQLGRILFEKLGLKPKKKTKTGYSTEVKVLEELAREHDLPLEILNWRSLSKLKSTYVDALPKLINPETGRIHTTFNQAVTATGRLSSSDPNLQNIPVRGEMGLRIRRAFVAEKGYYLLSADYSQIELRILAHLSGDSALVEAFRTGVDIHTRTAMEIFDVGEDAVTPDMRRIAKTVNFGVIYGMSAFGLSEAIGVGRNDAQDYIDQYFLKHEGVQRYVQRIIEEARRLGYVRTLSGRKRAIPELSSGNAQQRALGERLAMNTPIQGTAADIIKMAMIRIYRRLKREGYKSRMILQVHDELLFEVKEDELDSVKDLVKEEMEGVMELKVPLKVEIGYGKDWAEAHG